MVGYKDMNAHFLRRAIRWNDFVLRYNEAIIQKQEVHRLRESYYDRFMYSGWATYLIWGNTVEEIFAQLQHNYHQPIILGDIPPEPPRILSIEKVEEELEELWEYTWKEFLVPPSSPSLATVPAPPRGPSPVSWDVAALWAPVQAELEDNDSVSYHVSTPEPEPELQYPPSEGEEEDM